MESNQMHLSIKICRMNCNNIISKLVFFSIPYNGNSLLKFLQVFPILPLLLNKYIQVA